MILVVTGTRTFGELEYDTAKRGEGKLDSNAVLIVNSFLDGLWTESTMGYLTVDLFGFTIIEGKCPTGLDRIARDWARHSPMHNYDKFPAPGPDGVIDPATMPDQPPFRHVSMPANWTRYNRAAGPIRNGEMIKKALALQELNEDMLVVGWFDKPEEDSSGTSDCIAKAKAAGLPHITLRYYERV